jgi:purine-binding chemotaxis protein CheW
MEAGIAGDFVVLCRVGTRLCGVPIEHVAETMRPLPVEPVAGMPAFVRGLSVIRGAPVPVVDAAALLSEGAPEGLPGRYVTLELGDRRVALAVDEVRGIRRLAALRDLPPLFAEAGNQAVESVGTLDGDLLLVLKRTRLIPESVWAALETAGATG